MKKIVIFILLFLIVSSVAVSSYNHKVIALKTIQYSTFKQIRKNVFVSPETTEKQKADLLNLLKKAEERIKNTFGSYTASPIIIASHNEVSRQKFSRKSYASAILLPFSQSEAYVTIGENGHNLDIISHELLHAEVFHRLGYFNQIFKVPVWFNEGVAMQVDFREKYKSLSANNSDIKKLWYGWQFFKGDGETLTYNYSSAKKEVELWLKNSKKEKLYSFLNKIKNGESFETLYHSGN